MTHHYTADFALEVKEIAGVCPAGEAYAQKMIAEKKTPVFSCEGPCIRGDIARLAANIVANEVPSFARACHAETFFVPHSSMARWVAGAEKAIMIDGCFLTCHGRVLTKWMGKDRVIQIDAFSLYKKYADIFSIDGIPEDERRAIARDVADKIIATLKEKMQLETGVHTPSCHSDEIEVHRPWFHRFVPTDSFAPEDRRPKHPNDIRPLPKHPRQLEITETNRFESKPSGRERDRHLMEF